MVKANAYTTINILVNGASVVLVQRTPENKISAVEFKHPTMDAVEVQDLVTSIKENIVKDYDEVDSYLRKNLGFEMQMNKKASK